MNLNEYQEAAKTTAVYQDSRYPILAIGEEVGELQGVFAKAMRKGKPHDVSKAVSELGDVLWNVAMIAYEIGFSLDEVANINLAKLQVRQHQGTLDLMERSDG